MQERFTARLRVKVRQNVVSMYTVEKRIAYEEKKQYLNETGSGMLSIPFNRTLITASHYLALPLFTAPTQPIHALFLAQNTLKIRKRKSPHLLSESQQGPKMRCREPSQNIIRVCQKPWGDPDQM